MNRNARSIGIIYPDERVERDVEGGELRFFLTYERVVRLGCQFEVSWTAWGEESDCGHGYAWGCDSCPVNKELEKSKHEVKQKQKQMYREY